MPCHIIAELEEIYDPGPGMTVCLVSFLDAMGITKAIIFINNLNNRIIDKFNISLIMTPGHSQFDGTENP